MPNRAGARIGIIATVVVLAVIVGLAVWKGTERPAAPPATTSPAAPGLTVVKGLIGSEKKPLFDDPEVRAAFARAGLDVRVDTAGSVAMLGADAAAYDFLFPGSAPVATELAAKHPGSKSYSPFYSPLTVMSFKPIVALMEKAGVARTANGHTSFDVAAYLKLVGEGKRWSDIPGNDTYVAGKSILVTTTNPQTSNSALMFLSLAAYVANGNKPVVDAAGIARVKPAVAPLFTDQGYKESSSEAPFIDYLALGAGKTPMLNGYESQLLAHRIAKNPAVTDDMVVMYPDPGMMSKHTLVSLNAQGERLGELLGADPAITAREAAFGFRTLNAAAFNDTLAAAGVPAPPQLANVVDPSSYAFLEALLKEVAPR